MWIHLDWLLLGCLHGHYVYYVCVIYTYTYTLRARWIQKMPSILWVNGPFSPQHVSASTSRRFAAAELRGNAGWHHWVAKQHLPSGTRAAAPDTAEIWSLQIFGGLLRFMVWGLQHFTTSIKVTISFWMFTEFRPAQAPQSSHALCQGHCTLVRVTRIQVD